VAGDIAPQPHLQGGIRLDDHVGYRFAAILQPDFAADLPIDIRERFVQRGIATVVAGTPEPAAWLRDIEAPAVVVRPDRYILGAARSVRELRALTALV
jgi:3-(3-hydroxy-phenyl)propionate hydroxylase